MACERPAVRACLCMCARTRVHVDMGVGVGVEVEVEVGVGVGVVGHLELRRDLSIARVHFQRYERARRDRSGRERSDLCRK